MKKFISRLFSAGTTSSSYLREIKDFLLGIILPIILLCATEFIHVDSPFRMLMIIPIGILMIMNILFFARLLNVSDNRAFKKIKKTNYKFKYKPIKLPVNDFIYWIKNAEIPETIYVKSASKINYKFDISFDASGKRNLFTNKKFYLDDKEIKSEEECLSIMYELNIIFDDSIDVYETFDHNKPDYLLKIIRDLKNK